MNILKDTELISLADTDIPPQSVNKWKKKQKGESNSEKPNPPQKKTCF